MIYLLFIGMLILFFVSFFLFQKNILNPSVILCSVFLVSLFFTILNIKNWEIKLHSNTVLLILETVIAFILGNGMIYLLPRKYKTFSEFKNENIEIKVPSFKIMLIINIILSILLYKYFREIYKLSLIGGNPGGYNLMLFYAREAQLKFNNVNRVLTYAIYFVKSISYVCLFILSYNSIYKKFKIKNLVLVTPTLIYLGFIILSTGRTEFIYLLVFILVMFFTLYQQKYSFDSKLTKKIIIYGILILLLFFVIFSLVGLLTGKTQSRSIFEMISIYVGSSIPALDIYINSPIIPNTYFGENTLIPFYKILRVLGYEKGPLIYPASEFLFFGGIATNIYTAIRKYYQDFGIVGLNLITFLLGCFYGIFFHYSSYKKNNFFCMILYSNLCYPIFMFVIEDLFLTGFFPTGIIYNFVALGVTYYLLVYKNRKKQKIKEEFK